jgi:hypothetical protein
LLLLQVSLFTPVSSYTLGVDYYAEAFPVSVATAEKVACRQSHIVLPSRMFENAIAFAAAVAVSNVCRHNSKEIALATAARQYNLLCCA